jgi:hypothetical protein
VESQCTYIGSLQRGDSKQKDYGHNFSIDSNLEKLKEDEWEGTIGRRRAFGKSFVKAKALFKGWKVGRSMPSFDAESTLNEKRSTASRLVSVEGFGMDDEDDPIQPSNAFLWVLYNGFEKVENHIRLNKPEATENYKVCAFVLAQFIDAIEIK